MVGFHQALGFGQALLGVAAQQAGIRSALQDEGQFPSQVEGVLHGHVHALARFGGVGVTGVTGNEDTRVAIDALGHVIKAVGDAVADVIDGPPDHFFHIDGVGMDDAVRRRNHVVLGELAVCGFFVRAKFVERHIHAKHITAFARQDQEVAFFGRRDQTLLAHIGEIGVGQNVHHAPGLIGSVTMQLTANRLAHGGMGTIAAHHIVCAYSFGGSPVEARGIFQRHGDGVVVGAVVNGQALNFPAVVGCQT